MQELTSRPFTPAALLEDVALTESDRAFILESREAVRAILKGEDPRLLLLVGPCSIHDPDAVYEYGERLAELATAVSSSIFIVMRAYVEKPRTKLGWKGFFYDPYLDGSYAMEVGARQTRELFARLTALRLPLGAEILELTTAPFYADYLSWGCIGARTSASPIHRQIASGLPFAMGFKNTVDGNVSIAVQAMATARTPHIFLGLSTYGTLARIHTSGNEDCHLIMRGSEERPNYFPDDLAQALAHCRHAHVCSRLIVDCSHGNSGKQHLRQCAVFKAMLRQLVKGNEEIAGLMLESFLEEGNQPLTHPLKRGISITDACLSWEMTKELICLACDQLATDAPSALRMN